ncbi:hypothetical protein FN846DRAFT_1012372 [Sphaerosporella brunnea]|uniref:Uncharacterized protein n=1 Tax=Sphaerosporella brunnea TaxID=1250544 RepID=A0A5J5EY76_9PEZI|nr:hypothetical protein FN846DRAFT_1012372 [Sphaerosporella brunnea]
MDAKTATEQDHEVQLLMQQGNINTALGEQIETLSNRIGAMRTDEHMVLLYYVSVRSALLYVGLINDPAYSLDVNGHAPELNPCLPPFPDRHLLAATFTQLRACAVFRAAATSVERRMSVPIVFDDTRTVDVSCSLVHDCRAAAVPRRLRLMSCQIGLGHAAKANTNALMQVLFCVPVLRRLLHANRKRNIATLRYLEDLDAARNTMEIHKIQTMLLALFDDTIDNALDVLMNLFCKISVSTMTTTHCVLHKGCVRDVSAKMTLTCTDTVNRVIANASAESDQTANRQCDTCRSVTTQTVNIANMFNSESGILLVEPSAGHPLTEVDEECGKYGEWKLCAGLLPGGRAFFSDGEGFHLYRPRAGLPCALISQSFNYSIERLCDNDTPLLLFYVLTVLDRDQAP